MSGELTEARPGAPWRPTSAEWGPVLWASLIFCVLISVGAGGVRGTDQYWYVADVATIADGGPRTTNHVFPVNVLEGAPISGPFFHNGPVLYVVATVARLIGAYTAWIVCGVLFSLVTAWVIAWSVAARTSVQAGAWAGAAYLVLPITVWQSSQPLVETWLAFLTVSAAALLAYPSERRSWRWVAAALIVGVLFWSRYTFLPLLVAMPVVFGIVRRRDLGRSWHTLLLLVGIATAFVSLGPLLFPSNVSFTFAEFINGTSTWRETDMLFVRPDDTLSLWTVLRKGGHAALQQVLPDIPASGVFYWPFTCMAVAFVVGVRSRRMRWSDSWTVITVLVLAIHLATIVLYRNQFRYILPVTPPLLISLAICASGWRFNRALRWGGAMLFAGAAVVSIAMMNQSRVSGHAGEELRSRLAEIYSTNLSDNKAMLVQYPEAGGFVHAYVLRPRVIAYYDASLTQEELQTIRTGVDAGWVVTADPDVWRQDSLRLAATLPVNDTLRVGLYRLEGNN